MTYILVDFIILFMYPITVHRMESDSSLLTVSYCMISQQMRCSDKMHLKATHKHVSFAIPQLTQKNYGYSFYTEKHPLLCAFFLFLASGTCLKNYI